MVFDGSKESCPNYNQGENNRLDKSYRSFIDPSVISDELYGTENFNKTCFNICATKNNDETKTDKGATFIENETCFPCSSSSGNTNNPDFGTKNYLMNAGRYKMCNIPSDSDSGALPEGSPSDTIPLWFTRQQDANILGDTVDRINWSSAGSQLDATDTNSEAYKIQQYWKSTNKPLSNEEILRLIGNRTAGTLEYTLPEEYMKEQTIGNQINVDVFDFEKVRRDINDGRGSVVYCDSNTLNSWVDSDGNSTLKTEYIGCWNSDKKTYGNKNNNKPVFGPEHIVVEEVEDFITAILDNAKEESDDISGSATQFGNLLSGLQYDSAFEDCVNDKLNTIDDMDKDYDIQERIAGYTSIKDFKNEDIHYLKRKLRKIINMKTRDVTECMNLLNLGKSICATGVADKTLMIGSLIFKVIGNDRIDIMQADNDERYKINKLIDELGPLIPKAVKNIIKISKEYETRVCNVPTNTTLLLERLYMDLYDKETKVTFDFTPNFDLNFNELANTTNFWHFIQKITVLIVMSVLLFMAANFVTAFISRTQVVTQINDG